MKKYQIIACCFLASTLWGCNSLDVPNLSSYDANSVWSNPTLATAYVNNLYPSVYENWDAVSAYRTDKTSEQAGGYYSPFLEPINETSGGNYIRWHYGTIRRINEAIVELPGGGLTNEVKTSLSAQAHLLRAELYFDMVMHHGGMPIIKKPQIMGVDELNVPRNTTAECFDFIIEDLDTAIGGLPARIANSSADFGRVDKVYAMALKAKVLLYKASPLFNPKTPYTNAYWAEAYSAAKEAYDFAVANGVKLVDNYDDIILSEGNSEILLTVVNQYPAKGEAYARALRPLAAIFAGATWEMVKAFPMADGKAWNDPSGEYYVATEEEFLKCFWKNRDPRFYTSILVPGQEYPMAGAPTGFRFYTARGIAPATDAYGTNPASGVAAKNQYSTGLYIRKGVDRTLPVGQEDMGNVDHPVMRFAELMFIYAEACNETGHSDETMRMLKEIRKRAGIAVGDGNYGLPASPTREQFRDLILAERNVELCFEDHRFFDLRRTRNMMQLNGLTKLGLESIAITAPGGPDMPIEEAQAKAAAYELTTDNFRFVPQSTPFGENMKKSFIIVEEYYFFPIQATQLAANPELKQNTGWKDGTFNPALE